MVSKSKEQDKQISTDSVFDGIKSLLSDFKQDFSGFQKVIQEKLSENLQHDNTDSISLLQILS